MRWSALLMILSSCQSQNPSTSASAPLELQPSQQAGDTKGMGEQLTAPVEGSQSSVEPKSSSLSVGQKDDDLRELPCGAGPLRHSERVIPVDVNLTAEHEAQSPASRPVPPPFVGAHLSLKASESSQTIRLYFPLSGDPYLDCRAHLWVERRLLPCENPLQAALAGMMKGLLKSERQRGLVDPLAHPLSDPQGAPLADFFQGVSLTAEGVAVVEFSLGAKSYFNQPACQQVAVLDTIRRVALQFQGVKDVAYVLGGKLVTEWDA